MLSVLKENMHTIRKMTYEQKGTINIKGENKKKPKNFGTEKYNWSEKFNRGIQNQIWVGRRINKFEIEWKFYRVWEMEDLRKIIRA